MLLELGKGLCPLLGLEATINAAEDTRYTPSYQTKKPFKEHLYIAENAHPEDKPPVILDIFCCIPTVRALIFEEEVGGPDENSCISKAVETDEGEAGDGGVVAWVHTEVREGANEDVSHDKEEGVDEDCHSRPVKVITAGLGNFGSR